MSADPSDPKTFDPEFIDPETIETDADQAQEIDIEAPEADAAEQHAELVEQRDDPLDDRTLLSANPADAVEQTRVVELNEDDYP